jgi:hypothetical protein
MAMVVVGADLTLEAGCYLASMPQMQLAAGVAGGRFIALQWIWRVAVTLL